MCGGKIRFQMRLNEYPSDKNCNHHNPKCKLEGPLYRFAKCCYAGHNFCCRKEGKVNCHFDNF